MNSQQPEKEQGLRRRIITPMPPAPIPQTFKKKVARTHNEAKELAQTILRKTPGLPHAENTDSDSTESIVRAGSSMAIATMLSRITGFIRNVMIGAALGPAIGSAFNTANTLPNLITEIVLGAVLTSLVVPVLVRAEKEDPDHGAAFIRRLMTLSVSLLLIVTIVAVFSAPFLTRLSLGSEGLVNISQATAFAYLLLPQILFYGVFALFMAILNTKGVFKPGAWAPVVNNIVVIGVLALYWAIPGTLSPHEQVSITDPHILLLGVGTTLGVIVQAAIMLPALHKQRIDLRPLWGIDSRLKQFGGMAVAIIIYVAISQTGYILTTRIASGSDPTAPMIYQQAWLFLQVPYGIIGVTLLTALMPRLSRAAADGDHKGVVSDLTMATKLTFISLIPIIIFMTVFGVHIAHALFAYGAFDRHAADLLGTTLSFSAFTLIPYALVLLHLRVFYAREEAWTPTFIIAGITITKVVLSFLSIRIATSPQNVVVLLGTANGFGFIAGACIGAMLLKQKLGDLRSRSILHTTYWAVASSAVAAFIAYYADFLLARLFAHPGSFFDTSVGFIIRLIFSGVIFLLITGLILSRSSLEEVRSLGSLLVRLPGMNRVIHIKPQEKAAVAEPTEVSMQLQISEEAITALPLPPMSAGMVRPPRFVPGAPIANGSFRLLRKHGESEYASFWQAVELATGREVSLSFVDVAHNEDAPVKPSQAAGMSAEIARTSRKIAGLSTAGIQGLAHNMRIYTYRSGCLIVADWVAGASVSDISTSDPQAAALAVSTVASAAASAHSAGMPLGISDSSRVRIDTRGNTVLAFPAVLPNSSYEQDVATCLDILGQLIAHSTEKNADIEELLSVDPADISAADLAHRLLVIGGAGEHIEVTKENTPAVKDARGGFGGRGYSSKMKGLIAGLFVIAVIISAIIILSVLGFLGSHNRNAPIQSNVIPAITENSSTSSLPPIDDPLRSLLIPPVFDFPSFEPMSSPEPTVSAEVN